MKLNIGWCVCFLFVILLTPGTCSDPGDNVFFSDLLFDNEPFAKAMFNSLNKDGVFIAQTGIANNLDDPSSMNGRDKHGFLFKTRLREAGFTTIKEYEDVSLSGFVIPY